MKRELIIFSIATLIFVTPVLAQDNHEGRIPDEDNNPKLNHFLPIQAKILGINIASTTPNPTPTPNCGSQEREIRHKDCKEDKNDSREGEQEDNNDQEAMDNHDENDNNGENEDHHSPSPIPSVSPSAMPSASPSASPSATPPITSFTLFPTNNFTFSNMGSGWDRFFKSFISLFSFFSHHE